MSTVINENELHQELRKVIDLPESAVSVDIHLAVNEVATVTCECWVNEGTGDKITQKFHLVPAEPEVREVTRLGSKAREWVRAGR